MWKPGDRLRHRYNAELGPGRVIEASGRWLSVEFPDSGEMLRLAADSGALAALELAAGSRVTPSPRASLPRWGEVDLDRLVTGKHDGRLRSPISVFGEDPDSVRTGPQSRSDELAKPIRTSTIDGEAAVVDDTDSSGCCHLTRASNPHCQFMAVAHLEIEAVRSGTLSALDRRLGP